MIPLNTILAPNFSNTSTLTICSQNVLDLSIGRNSPTENDLLNYSVWELERYNVLNKSVNPFLLRYLTHILYCR